MGLNSLIKNSIESAFNVLGTSDSDGLQVSISYYQVTSKGSYSPTLGTSTPVESLTVFEGIKYQSREREIDGVKIQIDETRLIFPSSRVSFTPTADDRIEIGSDKYGVVTAFQDPAGATWTLYLRGA